MDTCCTPQALLMIKSGVTHKLGSHPSATEPSFARTVFDRGVHWKEGGRGSHPKVVDPHSLPSGPVAVFAAAW
jgi:hypothetical protein